MNAFPQPLADRLISPALRLVPVLLALGLASCSDATGPGGGVTPPPGDTTVTPPPDTAAVLPPTGVARSDLTPEGTVVDTPDGYTVSGSLTMATSDTSRVTFTGAEVRVRFDAQDRVTSISGRVTIPSPHPRITFHDPVRAEIGLFSGAYLNEHADLGIRVRDDTDYVVYDYQVAVGMDIATGETGDEATKPVTLKVPVGGRALMVVDYTDPMYYVYGEHDLLGAMGYGWSLNGRIPFAPHRTVEGLGTFEGKTTRVGTFPIFKVFSVSGQTVDNNYTEVHLVEEDPWASDLRKGFQQGWNGAFDLDLSIKDMVGFVVPVADGSGGIFAEASVQGGLAGHAYGVGATTRDGSWWPRFVPVKPANVLDVDAFVTHEGRFRVGLSGQYGWEFPDGVHGMGGLTSLSDDAFEVAGSILSGPDTFVVAARVTNAATTATFEPPGSLMEAIASLVNDDVLPRIDSAQAAWDDLQKATGDYELELSLRGIRTQLPGIVAEARRNLDAAVEAELRPHRGTIYYNTLRSEVNKRTAPYYADLATLDREAKRATDNATTRRAIQKALRDVAGRKIFRETIRITLPVVGTVYSRTIERRIMSDATAGKLLEAASHVPKITETSDRRIRLQQVYDEVPDRQLFEEVRDDLRDGLLVMRDIGRVGFVFPHAEGQRAYNAFVEIDGRAYQAGTVPAMTVEAWADALWTSMREALRVN